MSYYNSTMHRQVPARSLSRVSSYSWFGSLISSPLGLAIAGPAVSVLSLRATLLVVGSLMILAILPLLGVRSIWNLTDESSAPPMPQVSER
jgi:hypothetical protein